MPFFDANPNREYQPRISSQFFFGKKNWEDWDILSIYDWEKVPILQRSACLPRISSQKMPKTDFRAQKWHECDSGNYPKAFTWFTENILPKMAKISFSRLKLASVSQRSQKIRKSSTSPNNSWLNCSPRIILQLSVVMCICYATLVSNLFRPWASCVSTDGHSPVRSARSYFCPTFVCYLLQHSTHTLDCTQLPSCIRFVNAYVLGCSLDMFELSVNLNVFVASVLRRHSINSAFWVCVMFRFWVKLVWLTIDVITASEF